MSAALMLSLLAVAFAIPSNLMLPLDTCVNDQLKSSYNFAERFKQLKDMKFDGVMVDVWWGQTEKKPQEYTFQCYKDLAKLAKESGLKLHVVTSFHACGSNTGDSVFIPIPEFVRNAVRPIHGFYEGPDHVANEEYIGLHVDEVSVIPTKNGGTRTPIEAYTDWFNAFKTEFKEYIDAGIIDEMEVSMGAAGELRYPSYKNNTYPHLGAFQCYDNNSIAEFAAAAKESGYSYDSPPNDVCYKPDAYSCFPNESPFFNGGLDSVYGSFFINWYADRLKMHGYRVLKAARSVFGKNMELVAKVSGIHWLYLSNGKHAAELASGYPNYGDLGGYDHFAQLFSLLNVTFDWTALEKIDGSERGDALSAAGSLARQIMQSCARYGVRFAGENALPVYDSWNLGHVVDKYKEAKKLGAPLGGYTHLRFCDAVFNNKQLFTDINNQLH